MEYASHVDSHKGNSSKGVKSLKQPMETQMMSQIKTLMESQVKSNQVVQQQLMKQAMKMKQQAAMQLAAMQKELEMYVNGKNFLSKMSTFEQFIV